MHEMHFHACPVFVLHQGKIESGSPRWDKQAGKPGALPSTGCFPQAKTPGKMEPRKEKSSFLQACDVQEEDRERQGTSGALEVPQRSNISLVCLGYEISDQKKEGKKCAGDTTSQDQTDKILVHWAEKRLGSASLLSVLTISSCKAHTLWEDCESDEKAPTHGQWLFKEQGVNR